MKITIFTLQLKKFGGIERFITTLADILNRTGAKVTIASLYGKTGEKTAFEIPENVQVDYLLPELPNEVSMKKILTQCRFLKIIPELKRRHFINKDQREVFKKYCSKLDADVIITDRAMINTLVGVYYKGHAKKIATDHNFHQNNKKYINELLKSLRGFECLVVASEELRKFYEPLVRKIKCVFIPNALAEIPQKKSSLTTKNIISVGRFVKEKDFLTLIDVIKKVNEFNKDVRLFLVGDGEEFSDIQEKVKELGLEKTVILTGTLKQEDVERYYYDSSLFVMTSKTEAFGLVLAEAMSYGLPVVAFNRASGARAQVNEQNGVLIDNADIDLMAKKIIELLNNKKMLKNYQTGATKSAEKLDKTIISEKWQKIVYNL